MALNVTETLIDKTAAFILTLASMTALGGVPTDFKELAETGVVVAGLVGLGAYRATVKERRACEKAIRKVREAWPKQYQADWEDAEGLARAIDKLNVLRVELVRQAVHHLQGHLLEAAQNGIAEWLSWSIWSKRRCADVRAADGQPTVGRSPPSELREAIADGRRRGIHLVGLGLGPATAHVADFYAPHFVAQIPPENFARAIGGAVVGALSRRTAAASGSERPALAAP